MSASTKPRDAFWGPLLMGGLVVLFCLALLARNPSTFFHDDFQLNYLPPLRDMARALQHGEWPLLSPYAWFGGNLAGEWQYGVFSAFMLPLVLVTFALPLSLPASAAVLAVTHLAVLASGAYALARRLQLAPEGAALVAIACALNGFVIDWGAMSWFATLSSFAWVPWAWRYLLDALEVERGPWRFAPAGFFIYLTLASGYPFSVLSLVLVTGWLSYRHLAEQNAPRPLWALAAAWGLGTLLAAPALAMLLLYFPATVRSSDLGSSLEWQLPLSSLVGLFSPFSAQVWNMFGRYRPHLPLELSGALVPVSAVLAAVLGAKRDARRAWLLRSEVGFAALVLLLCLLPSPMPLRWSFRWLPLFHLALALAGAQALALLKAEGTPPTWRRRPALWALVGVGTAWLLSDTPLHAGQALYLLPILLWAWAEFRARADAPQARFAPAGTALATLGVVYAVLPLASSVPSWKLPDGLLKPAPLEQGRRYMALTDDDYRRASLDQQPFGLLMRPGNTPMLAGVEFLHGYSPMGPSGLVRSFFFETHGLWTHPEKEAFLARELGPHGLLALSGVDGLVLSPALANQEASIVREGWRVVHRDPEGLLLHRISVSPRVRSLEHAEAFPDDANLADRLLERPPAAPAPLLLSPREGRPASYARAELRGLHEGRNQASVDLEVPAGEHPALVAFARPWYPGYRAFLQGREIPVDVLDAVLIAVEVPAGSKGRLEVVFRPRALEGTLGLCALGWLLLLAALSRRIWQRPALPAAA